MTARLIPLIPLASTGPRPGPRRMPIGASVLLHVLAAALLLLLARRPTPEAPSPPAYDLVFEDGSPPAPAPSPAAADRMQPEDTLPSPPAPSPLVPPDPDSTEVAPPAVALAPPPPPQLDAPAPEPQAMPAMPSAPPTVRLTEPAPPPRPAEPEFTVPVPPAPPAPPAPPRPRAPPPVARLPAPMDLNFGPAVPRPAPPPRGSVASRAIDLSLGAPKPGVNRAEAYFEVRARNVSADWKAGLQAYWMRHRYYPRQAAEAGEDGTVVIEMVVNRQGRVESVEVKSRSGSPWLDMAAVGTWRNAQLPPLPAETAEDRITLAIPIHYVLVR